MSKVTHLTIEEGGAHNRRRIHLREISGDLDSPLETVGQDLRAARLRRGDDLATVSKALKIRKDHLEALEEDRIEALPGRAYAVGFARTYADYLGLDAGLCVERFKAQIAGRGDDTTPTITVIDEDEHRRLPQGWKIIAGVVVLLMIYGAYYVISTTSAMMAQPVTPPPPQVTPKPAAVHHAPPPKQASLTPPPSANGAPAAPAMPAAAPGQAPSGATPSGATPAPGSPAAAAGAPLPNGQVYGGQNLGARVVLRIHQATRVLVQGPDGKVFINRTLQPGDTYQVPNIVGLTLTTTNANFVEIDLDGSAMGYAGKQGMAEAISLDPQAIVDHSGAGGQ